MHALSPVTCELDLVLRCVLAVLEVHGSSVRPLLGQRAFRIALVHDDGTLLPEDHWGPRAAAKLRYLIPFIGWFWFGARDLWKARSSGAEYRTGVTVLTTRWRPWIGPSHRRRGTAFGEAHQHRIQVRRGLLSPHGGGTQRARGFHRSQASVRPNGD